jgi:hypothetical protein
MCGGRRRGGQQWNQPRRPAARPVRLREEIVINHIRSLCPAPASLPGRAGMLIASFATAPAIVTAARPLPASAQR